MFGICCTFCGQGAVFYALRKGDNRRTPVCLDCGKLAVHNGPYIDVGNYLKTLEEKHLQEAAVAQKIA